MVQGLLSSMRIEQQLLPVLRSNKLQQQQPCGSALSQQSNAGSCNMVRWPDVAACSVVLSAVLLYLSRCGFLSAATFCYCWPHLLSRPGNCSVTALVVGQFSHAVMTTSAVVKGCTHCIIAMSYCLSALEYCSNALDENAVTEGLTSASAQGGCRVQSWPQQQDQQ